MLFRKLGAGRNYYIGSRSEYSSTAKYYKAWKKAKAGDFLKIFRDADLLLPPTSKNKLRLLKIEGPLQDIQ